MKKKLLPIFTGAFVFLACAAFAACDKNTPEYGWVNVGGNTQTAQGDKENYGIVPIIEVDYGAYSKGSIPAAVKGKAYKVFPATANDIYGTALTVETNVYINYYTETRALVSVHNGGFTPANYGVYTVEYVAVDSFGNEAKLVYDVRCSEKEPITATVLEGELEGKVGKAVSVADLEIENASGEVSVSVVAESKKGYAKYAIGEDGTFVPEYADSYDIVYTYSDYNETGTATYTVAVAENPEPVFKQEIALNDYYIVGCAYNLPQSECFYSENGKKYEVLPSISVSYESGKTVYLRSTSFTPEEEGALKITYTANFAEKKQIQSYTATAVDVGYTGEMTMESYLYGENIKTQAYDYGILVRSVENTAFDFINPVSSREVSVKFGIDPMANLFNRLDIYLTDSADKENTIKLSYVRNGKGGTFYVNDDDYGILSQGYLTLETTELYYDNATQTATLGDSIALKISKNLKGEKFKGFEGDTVQLRFAFEEVSGYVGVYLYQIGNQVLSSGKGDGFRPFLNFSIYKEGIHYVGDEIEIDRIWVCDVLDPDYTVQYSVRGPDGQYVKDIYGNVLNTETDYTESHRFTATMIGNYIVNIVVSDSCENEQKFSYAIIVTDGEAPVLRFGAGETMCAFGESITLKKAMGYDNITENLEIYVYVCSPLLDMAEVKMGESYTPTQKGTYVVYAYAQDEHGNVGMTRYTFEVK